MSNNNYNSSAVLKESKEAVIKETSGLSGYPAVDKPWLKYYTREAIESEVKESSLYDYIYERNKDYPGDKAIEFYGKGISYDELFGIIKKTAGALYAYGVRRNDIVAVCLPAIPEVAYLIYALDYIGAIPNLLDPRYNAKLLKICMDEAPAKMLFTLDSCYDRFLDSGMQEVPENIVLISPVSSAPFHIRLAAKLRTLGKPGPRIRRDTDMWWDDFMAAQQPEADIRVRDKDGDECAVLLHTGGSTGKPKGVMLSANAVNSISNECFWLAREHAVYERGYRLLDIIPPFASYGLCASLNLGLGLGIIVDMVPKFDSSKFGRLMVKHQSNVVVGVPSFFEAMAEDPAMRNADMSFLKFAVCGGDSLTYERESAINAFLNSHGSPARINAGYGMTEVGSVATVCLGEMKKTGSIGVPLVKTMVKAVDPETGKDCRYNETGEICIHSPGMMIGYWKDEELTAKTVRVHDDGLRWVHTGDLGYVTEEGFLIYQGRIKRLIVRYDGFKIYPQAVEEAITKHPAVSNCAVVRKMDENLGAIAKAYIVLSNDAAAGVDPWDEILKICSEEMAERSVPQAHEIIDSMPVSSIGKIDYKALEKR